jgi:hypothetical protein
MEEPKRDRQKNDIQLAPLQKDGEKLMQALENGHMVAILSKGEILYAFREKDYQCYIHPLGSQEGRCKRFQDTEPNRAIIKNLATLGDQLFEVTYEPHMHALGVMASAEQGILEFLEAIGQLPVEDFDFMAGETVQQ